MKYSKIIFAIFLFAAFLFTSGSCTVLLKENNGKHKGWYKNPKDHHEIVSTNPGHSKGRFHK